MGGALAIGAKWEGHWPEGHWPEEQSGRGIGQRSRLRGALAVGAN